MLSICIPVYNFYISSLAAALIRQADALPIPCEIICIDDASADEYRQANRMAAENIRYIQLPENIGRARIRNLFLDYATFGNLLFLDCDSLIINEHFITDYMAYINQNPGYNVLCGGRIYEPTSPGKKYQLRWLYGVKRESMPASKRRQHPNAAFMTNNFIIQKAVLSLTRFDERLKNYGHEDTLFGYALQNAGIVIHHIDNPVLNGHLETNEEYLFKTRQAVSNLASIVVYINDDNTFTETVSLLRFYKRLQKSRSIIRHLFSFLRPSVELLLSKGYINIGLFNFYKLGLLTEYMHQLSKQQ